MSTYQNCYTMLELIRRGLRQYSTALVQGTDTSGPFHNDQIIQHINDAQRAIHALLFRRIPHEFLEKADITGSDSVFDLPWDFGTLREFRDDDGVKVFPSGVSQLPTDSGTGSDLLYYRKGQTLVLNKSGVNATYTLWYYRKPRELTMGQVPSGGGGTNTIKLGSSAKAIADYYNGMTLENITKDTCYEITDYTAARIATISGTSDDSDWYGMVSDLPEPFHHLILSRALLTLRLLPVSLEPPSKLDLEMWVADFNDTLAAFAGDDSDVASEDIWCDYADGAAIASGGVNIPGQGYTIW